MKPPDDQDWGIDARDEAGALAPRAVAEEHLKGLLGLRFGLSPGETVH